MPFKSEKQRLFLKINNPEIYRKWVRKYGKKIRKHKSKAWRRGSERAKKHG